MFDTLTERLSGVVRSLRGQARLTPENIDEALRDVRRALLEADVALPVVREFIERVRERALGQEVVGSLTPGQMLIGLVRDELVEVMGEQAAPLELKGEPPAVVLMAGLQGTGKTTTLAKLAKLLHEREGRRVLVASADVHRPAAIHQLEVLAAQVGVDFVPASAEERPLDIAARALEQARKGFYDVLLVDTAGRLHIDQEMMDEVASLHAALAPAETLFVVDAMTGQDAANTARAFAETLPLTGVVLSKADGDARGGAALSVRHVTGRPIKFIGVGEKLDALEPFHPERIASRILGMGDVLSLIEQAERTVDRDKAERLAKKVRKGKGFDLQDFRDQIAEMAKLGGVGALIDKLPGMTELPPAVARQFDDAQMRRFAAIIDSMTPHERRFPAVIKASRKRRIAAGSGTQVQDVNRLLKHFAQSQKMMKKMSRKGGMRKLMRGLGGGGMPPGALH